MELNCSKSWSHHHFTYLLSWKKSREGSLTTHTADSLVSAGFLLLIMGENISIHGETAGISCFTFISYIHVLALNQEALILQGTAISPK